MSRVGSPSAGNSEQCGRGTTRLPSAPFRIFASSNGQVIFPPLLPVKVLMVGFLFIQSPWLHAQKPSPTPLERTYSTSQQFIIYGSTRTKRAEVARKADALSASFVSSTGLSAEWKWPIVMNLNTKPLRGSDRPRTSLFLGDEDTIKIQVDVPASSARSETELELEILRALALEFAYREAKPRANKHFSLPPEWLVEGIWQKAAAGTHGLSAALFNQLVQSGPPPKIDAFLKQRPQGLDPTSRAIYRAQSMTLLNALLETKNGKEGLAAYLTGLHAVRPEDPQPLLAAFPELEKDPTNLVKLWTLAIARASAVDQLEALSVVDTEKQLSLVMEDLRPAADPKKPDLEKLSGPLAMPPLSKDKNGRFLLARKAEELLRLEGRAHPVYQPIVEEYRLIASELADKPRRDAEKRLMAVGELRAALYARCEAMSDYVNWFEATKLDTPSEAFPENLGRSPEKSAMPRSDAISLAIDTAEKTSRK